MKRLLILIVLLIPCMVYAGDKRPKKAERDSLKIAQLDTMLFNAEFLDTVSVHKKVLINDYSMIGVDYGVTFCNTLFNPSRHNRAWVVAPNYFSIMYTHYEKMFGYLPHFGFRIGFDYSHEGAGFKFNEETGMYYNYVDGANKILMEVVEMPVLAAFHVDAAPVKFQGELGVYGGYRKSIVREGEFVPTEFLNDFRDYEYRFDYGMRGGAGFALMFDPIEIHFNAVVRWAWQSLYEPDYNSEYYYRFAYPLDVTATVGIHIQLGKRTGKTSADLRRQAKETVYGKVEDPQL